MSDRTRRLSWRIGIGAAVLAVVSAGAFGIAAAASGPDAPVAEPTQAEDHGPPWAGHGGWGGGDRFGLFEALGDLDVSDVSHAEVTLVRDGGGSVTMLVQKGVVTAVDDGSIAVRGADGHAATYTVDAGTRVNGDERIDSVAKDRQVLVVAPEGGERPTADVVLDLSELGWR